jgi:hypothetical protein
MTRYRDQVSYYVDKDERAAQMNTQNLWEEFRETAQISDAEMQEFIANSTSRPAGKISSLDFKGCAGMPPAELNKVLAERGEDLAASLKVATAIAEAKAKAERNSRVDTVIQGMAAQQDPAAQLRMARIWFERDLDGVIATDRGDHIHKEGDKWVAECREYPDKKMSIAVYLAIRDAVKVDPRDKEPLEVLNVAAAKAVLGYSRDEAPHFRSLAPAVIDSANANDRATVLQNLRTRNTGLSAKVIRDAEEAGFLAVVKSKEGPQLAFVGRDETQQPVSVWGTHKAEPRAVRSWYPPILRGDDYRIHVVNSGEEALAVWQLADDRKQIRPTVIVLSENAGKAKAQLEKTDFVKRLIAHERAIVVDEVGLDKLVLNSVKGKAVTPGDGAIFRIVDGHRLVPATTAQLHVTNEVARKPEIKWGRT